MKKSRLISIALTALFLLAPFAAEARGKRTFPLSARGITPPQLLIMVPTALPEGITSKKVVLMLIAVEKDGSVTYCDLINREDAGSTAAKSAEEVVTQWRFKPATKHWPDGTVSDVRTRMVVAVPVA